MKEEVLDDLPSKDERGPSSVGQTLELFKGNVRETSKIHGGTHMGLSERIDTIMK